MPRFPDADRARQNYGDFLDRVGTRTAMESHGQDILDRMDETGESPRDVSDKFWNETYFELPAAAQQRFTRMLKNVSGFEPGDTIAVRPDKSGIVAQDWADVAKGLLPEKVEHLEGPERGLTALMKEANDRVSGHKSQQLARPAVQTAARHAGCTAGIRAGTENLRRQTNATGYALRRVRGACAPQDRLSDPFSLNRLQAPRAFQQFSRRAHV